MRIGRWADSCSYAPPSFDQKFSEVRNPNPVSDGQNYALDFLTNERPLSRDIDFRQKIDQRFPGVRNPNAVSNGRNYALDFLNKKPLLARDIDFR